MQDEPGEAIRLRADVDEARNTQRAGHSERGLLDQLASTPET